MKAISIKDKLPEFDKMVLLIDSKTSDKGIQIDCGYLTSINKDGPVFVHNLQSNDMFGMFGTKSTYKSFIVTHWLELKIEL